MSEAWSVNDVIKVPAASGGFRVWRVIGVLLGAEQQESVIEIETLDRERNDHGRMLVPADILDAFYGDRV